MATIIDLPPGHASVGLGQAPRRNDSRAGRIPPLPANGAGGRLRQGADAIVLARRRFEVTAVDCSPIAIEPARLRAEQHDALLRFVFDRRFRIRSLRRTVRLRLRRRAVSLHPPDASGTIPRYVCARHWQGFPLSVSGRCVMKQSEDGPPQVTEDEIHNELGRLFEFVHLRPTRLEGANPNDAGRGGPA